MFSRIYGVLLMSLGVASIVGAQTTVGGQVVDRTKNAPLPKVRVTLLNADSASVDSVLTGPDGTFMLTSAAGGTFRVRLAAPNAPDYLSDTLTVAAGAYVMRSFPIDAVPQPYFDFQVDKLAAPVKGSVAPRYPAGLREAGVSGCVLVEFVVDTEGKPERDTFRLIKVSHIGFALAVLKALPDWRFTPARVGATDVRQLVHQPVTFSVETERVVMYGSAIVMVDPGSAGRPTQIAPIQQSLPRPPKPVPPSCK